jgi:phosphatidylglycerol lysyltransferase
VAYVDTGRAWVAAGAPVAAPHDVVPVARRFIEAARDVPRRPCFFAVEARLAEAEIVSTMPIGEQPSWDPQEWAGVVRSARSLREQLRRARAKGLTVRALSADEVAAATSPVRPQVEHLVARWVASRKMAPMGFIVDVQPFDFAAERRWFAAERDGSLVGLLVAVPVYQRNGWLFEDVLRAEDSPNGTTEALIDAAMRALAAEGSRYATLGLAPLSGEVSPWLRFVRACARALYDFDGVHRFKAKLRPSEWVPIHLAWPRDGSGNVALVDALSAFTMRARHGHDRASFVRFGIETLAHAPALGVRVLALLLVPWTIALAVVPTARYFPSRAVQLGWVAWDIVLAVAMLVLAARWRPNLARVLAVGTSVDALLTLLEVVTDAAPRMRGPLDAALLTVACVGPVLATSQLWGALVWRSRQHA